MPLEGWQPIVARIYEVSESETDVIYCRFGAQDLKARQSAIRISRQRKAGGEKSSAIKFHLHLRPSSFCDFSYKCLSSDCLHNSSTTARRALARAQKSAVRVENRSYVRRI
jgi:hypothetical protein